MEASGVMHEIKQHLGRSDDLARFKRDVEEWFKHEILKTEELKRTRHDLPD
jgi:hypothetical protein